ERHESAGKDRRRQRGLRTEEPGIDPVAEHAPQDIAPQNPSEAEGDERAKLGTGHDLNRPPALPVGRPRRQRNRRARYRAGHDRNGHERDDQDRPPETGARNKRLQTLGIQISAHIGQGRRRDEPDAEEDDTEDREARGYAGAQAHLRPPRRPWPADRAPRQRRPSGRHSRSPAWTPPGRWR